MPREISTQCWELVVSFRMRKPVRNMTILTSVKNLKASRIIWGICSNNKGKPCSQNSSRRPTTTIKTIKTRRIRRTIFIKNWISVKVRIIWKTYSSQRWRVKRERRPVFSSITPLSLKSITKRRLQLRKGSQKKWKQWFQVQERSSIRRIMDLAHWLARSR